MVVPGAYAVTEVNAYEHETEAIFDLMVGPLRAIDVMSVAQLEDSRSPLNLHRVHSFTAYWSNN